MQRTPLTVFYAHADEDEEWRQRLENHLFSLRQEGKIVEWHRHKTAPGAHQEHIRNEQFAQAAIILMLISPDFLASQEHWNEMQQAWERHVAGDACVIPILLAWSPDGQRIASTNMSLSFLEEAVHIWNANDGRRWLKINLRAALIKSSSPGGVAWSPDSTRIASASLDKTVHVWQP
ncbi:MAG TPA: toll/interleukin-1 receptor domain-containing protein [Ktedonobacteraceae bacterium]|nr:toll/interleukin-1 receptor domain-containing protein [Ktedonobacteraceae bacterium]